ncbi:hypothetical protein [Saccharothrix syringae]|uniref:YopA central domain-containing protein n=1 Tax=Saccharothrix syringae TaxID=103733 RepID=A0A5Q0GWL5_SACSY|nr:hypothetical protein [Saccharothrix syringae]QFZ18506.1 hypothetical protein EKG83_14420 [Saccharothrix syringae]
MPGQESPRDATALVPVYPFNRPGQDIVLYDGPLLEVDGGEFNGSVRVRCGSELDIVWRLDDIPPMPWALNSFDEPDLRLQVHLPSGVHPVDGPRRTLDTGRFNAPTLGNGEARLRRVVLHWMNFPAIRSPGVIEQPEAGGRRRWTGRWQVTVDLWQLTMDCRPDHSDVWAVLREENNFVMTHVMEITRVDGADFTPGDVEPLLQALHFGASFGFGRWVAPAIPVGFDSGDAIVWQRWVPAFCDPARKGALAWLFESRSHDLHDLLTRAYAAFADPDREHTTRLLLSMAIESNHTGRVEQRIMTAFSAIELLTWVTLVLDEGMSKSRYDNLRAEGRLRRLLATARVPLEVDSSLQPALARFARAQAPDGVDGPTAVSRIRNRLVHPKMPRDEVHDIKGLLTDIWLLTRHYLNMLILKWLNYGGSYQTVLAPGGWAGDTRPVPWVVASK